MFSMALPSRRLQEYPITEKEWGIKGKEESESAVKRTIMAQLMAQDILIELPLRQADTQSTFAYYS